MTDEPDLIWVEHMNPHELHYFPLISLSGESYEPCNGEIYHRFQIPREQFNRMVEISHLYDRMLDECEELYEKHQQEDDERERMETLALAHGAPEGIAHVRRYKRRLKGYYHDIR